MTKTYDPKSYDLAVHFFADHPVIDTERNRDELSKAIQQAVEDFFESLTSPDIDKVCRPVPEALDL